MSIKKKARLPERRKKEFIVALVFPIFSLMIICAPKGLIPNYNFLGISHSFLSPALFLLLNATICYLNGVGFILLSCKCGKNCADISEVYNGRLLMLCSLFFLHIWVFLFIFAMSVFVSLVCIAIALVFSFCAVSVLSKSGKLAFFASLLTCLWCLSLLFLNIGVLFF